MENTILDLDEYLKDLEIKLYGKTFHIPVVKKSFATKFMNIFAKKDDITEEEIAEILLEFLNSNRENYEFKPEVLIDEFTAKQIRALVLFIVEQITTIEKN